MVSPQIPINPKTDSNIPAGCPCLTWSKAAIWDPDLASDLQNNVSFCTWKTSGSLGGQPRLSLAPFRDPVADSQWVSLPQPVGLPKAWCSKPKQCALSIFGLFFCFFFLFFWNMLLVTKHFSLNLGGLPWHLYLLSKGRESLHTNSGEATPFSQARLAPLSDCCLCLSLPAH